MYNLPFLEFKSYIIAKSQLFGQTLTICQHCPKSITLFTAKKPDNVKASKLTSEATADRSI